MVGAAYLAKSPNGHIRIDYERNGQQLIEMFETVNGATLETSFNQEGEILEQALLKPEKDTTSFAEEFISKFAEANLVERIYEEVELKKPCPKCKSQSLKRNIERFSSSIPIMPIYVCNSCGSKGFHLTDAYLIGLVYGNKSLFTEEETKELESNSAAFIKELREYIIRIFASKKVMNIQ